MPLEEEVSLTEYEHRVGIDEERMRLPSIVAFRQEAERRIVDTDVLACPNLVVPIRTRARPFGGLAERLLGQGLVLPDLPVGKATIVAPCIFMAVADEVVEVNGFFEAAFCAMGVSRTLPTITYAIVNQEFDDMLGVVERANYEQMVNLDDMGFDVPDHRYVRALEVRVR